jgi:glutaconate CoA-transferase subunit A
MPAIARTIDDALAPIKDGCLLAVPRESTGVAMAATRALIRRGVRNLRLVALPTSSLQADLLIGAGCVDSIETSAVSLGEFGLAPRFTAAILGRAIRPDVALFHAPMADRDGNVWIGRQRELMTMAHASEKTVVTVEKVYDGNLLEDRVLAAGTLPGFYVETVAVAERGGWPLPLPEHYAWDAVHLAEYARLAATEDGFTQYLDRYVYERAAA